MSQYTVQRGDTIAHVTQKLQTDWQTLRSQNPKAIGKSRINGNWFLREGAEITLQRKSFATTLGEAKESIPAAKSSQENTAPAVQSEYTVKAGDTLWGLAVNTFHVNLQDLIRDNGIENPNVLQVGQKLTVNKPAVTVEDEVTASWYGKNFHGKPMANGRPYNMFANTIAHKDLPLGTEVELNNPRTGESTKAVVTDRGPYIEGRDVDLSYGLARKLSLLENGIGRLVMKIL
ncbi:MAG: septal ring lytic transglycosylase RlpA family protein [Desulfobulbaceae bacterium]|nr:MAG: septal ring lytic transglycosylase RlpA family protein [Desulfobulbaceae bacterium]